MAKKSNNFKFAQAMNAIICVEYSVNILFLCIYQYRNSKDSAKLFICFLHTCHIPSPSVSSVTHVDHETTAQGDKEVQMSAVSDPNFSTSVAKVMCGWSYTSELSACPAWSRQSQK